MMGVVQADSAICCWDAKFTYNFWRPITAIRNADTDGNDKTIVDPNWTPLLTTPNFPEYSSGHSTFSGAGAALLTHLYGDNYSFTTTSPGLPGISRSFSSFNQARDEAGISRIYGGIHFMSANTAGKESGGKVADYVVKNLFKEVA
jgi:membrane-associated phospholipid phosphatase